MRTEEAILTSALEAANKMFVHLARSHQQASNTVPVTSESVACLDNNTIDQLDLYLSRFGKLQHFMANKLFRALARASLEDTSQDVSVLDTINQMAKFGVIENIDDWMKARLLHNAFAHEYLTDNRAIADNINNALQLFGLLGDTLASCQRFYREHIA